MEATVRAQMLQLEETIMENYGEKLIRAFYTSVAKDDKEANNYLCFTPTRIFYYKIKKFQPKLKWQMDWIDFDKLEFTLGTEKAKMFILLVDDKKVRVDRARYSFPRLMHEIKPVVTTQVKMFLGEALYMETQTSPEVVREEIQVPVVYVNKGGHLIINNIQEAIINRSFTSGDD